MHVTWEQFVATHASTVLTAALRILANPADADDVAQEVFVEILRSGTMPQLHVEVALLHTIATRRALDRLRARRQTIDLSGSEASHRDREPYEYAIANELEARLADELAALPPREAEVFCLIYFQQQAPADVARNLAISPGAVAKALCKAREKLSAAFGCSRSDVSR